MRKLIRQIVLLVFVWSGSALAQKMTVRDSDSNVMMEVNDEGTVGSITLPPSTSAPANTTNRLYNMGGVLFWNGSDLTSGGSSAWSTSGSNIFYNSGNVGIGTTNPTEALELSENKRIKLSTSLTNLGESALIKLKWANSTGKPGITWLDESDDRQAAIVAHDYLTFPDNRHQHLSLETSDNSGALQTRLQIPWGEDTVDIRTSDANFRIGGGHDFIVGSDGEPGRTILNSDTFISGTRKLGVGFGGASQAFYATASMELYRNGSDVELLIHEDAGANEAILHLRRGIRDWKIVNNGDLVVEVDDDESLRITQAGNVGIGTTSPNEKLSVAGTIESASGGFKFPDGSIQTTADSERIGTVLHASIPNINSNQTWYSMFGQAQASTNRTSFASPVAGTLSNLFIFPGENAPNVAAIVTATVIINDTDTALTLTHSGSDGLTVKGNTTDSVNINQGDLISVKFVETGGENAGTSYNVTFQLK